MPQEKSSSRVQILVKRLNKALRPLGIMVVRAHPLDLMRADNTFMMRFLHFARCFDQMRNLGGDIVECGVGAGRTLLSFAYLMKYKGGDNTLWGYDSFEGFPEPSEHDRSFRNPKKGQNVTKMEDVLDLLRRSGIGEDFLSSRLRLVKGFFEKTLHEYPGRPIALLHVDVDLYQSYLTVLQELYPKVLPGGVILFDEYGEDEKWPGARRAIEEYLGDRIRLLRSDEQTGKCFLVKDG